MFPQSMVIPLGPPLPGILFKTDWGKKNSSQKSDLGQEWKQPLAKSGVTWLGINQQRWQLGVACEEQELEGCLLTRCKGHEEKVCLGGCKFYIRAAASTALAGKKRKTGGASAARRARADQVQLLLLVVGAGSGGCGALGGAFLWGRPCHPALLRTLLSTRLLIICITLSCHY